MSETEARAIDEVYLAAAPAARRRALAQVFTPPGCAALMADWCADRAPGSVLDPAFGTGILTRALLARAPNARVTAFEIDPAAAAAGRRALAAAGVGADLRVGNYLDAPADLTFDAVIMNPPYLKRQNFPGAERRTRQVAEACGVHLTGLTNAYALFLLDSCRRLRPGGRLAAIIPTEWAGANFGGPVKRFLIDRGLLRFAVWMPDSALFGDAITTACVLLIENGEAPARVRSVRVPPGAEPPHLAGVLSGDAPGCRVADWPPERLRDALKWDDLFARGEAEVPPGYAALGDLATTRRGMSTGANGFFHVPISAARAARIRDDRLIPCVGKAADAPGPVFSEAHLAGLDARGRPARLIALTDPLSPEEAAYVARGEAMGVHLRHLTRHRTPWYAAERARPAPVWASVFGRAGIRFVLNAAGALNLTAFHGVHPHDPGLAPAIVAAMNSAHVQDLMRAHLRTYGGGLLKAEPRDLLAMPVPDLRRCRPATVLALAGASGERAEALAALAAHEAASWENDR